MNLPLFIAKRYLISKKKQNVINIISGVSVLGIIVGTAALVIVLSVLNGFTGLIESLFNNFDPDLKITADKGKMFNPETVDKQQIKSLAGVIHYAEIIEEVAMLKYGNQQYFAMVKGVPHNYSEYTKIDSLIVEGNFVLKRDGLNYGVVGRGIQYNLGIGLSFVDPIHIYVPKKGNRSLINPERSTNHNYVFPAGIYSVLEEIDLKYLIVDADFAADLFESNQNISAIELGLEPTSNHSKIQQEIKTILGPAFHVKNKYEQHDLIFKTMQSEKWAAYLILLFILIIASFNILGSLSMLIIDKKEDILILRSMGANPNLVRRIFLIEGWLISILGAFLGTFLGILICWIQIKFEIIGLPGSGSFVISAYPVEIVFRDIVFIFCAVILIGFVASWYPIRYISNKYFLQQNL